MDVLRDPIWQTVGVIVGLIGALTVFVGFVLHNPSAGKEKAKLISIVIAFSVLICLVVAGIIFLPQLQETISAHIPPSRSPSQVLTVFCDALKNKEYQTAYNQLASTMQKKGTESQFAASYSQFTDCIVKSVDDKSSFGTLTLKTTSSSTEGGLGIGGNGDYRYTLVIEGSAWKINSVCEFLPSFGGCVG